MSSKIFLNLIPLIWLTIYPSSITDKKEAYYPSQHTIKFDCRSKSKRNIARPPVASSVPSHPVPSATAAKSKQTYICHVCGMEFMYKSILDLHLLVHTGERNHVCPICDRAFAQKVNLNTHLRIHTGTVGRVGWDRGGGRRFGDQVDMWYVIEKGLVKAMWGKVGLKSKVL